MIAEITAPRYILQENSFHHFSPHADSGWRIPYSSVEHGALPDAVEEYFGKMRVEAKGIHISTLQS